MGTYIRNSLIVVALSVTSQLVFSTTAGYMLSKPGWKGRKAVWVVLIASMMFPFESIMVSLFLSIRDMGLVDNLAGVWLPGFVGAINVLLMRGAFLAVPREIEDSAMLDGADEWQRFRHLYLPSAWGAILVVVINTFISAWDDFLWPLIVLRSESNMTLTLGLSRLQNSSFGYDQRMVMAGSVISVVPVLVLFVITQRWFYKGVVVGGRQALTPARRAPPGGRGDPDLDRAGEGELLGAQGQRDRTAAHPEPGRHPRTRTVRGCAAR